MTLHPAHIALIDDTGQINPSELATVAADLTEQTTRDFGPIWNARALVRALSEQTRLPHYWPIRIRIKLNQPGALGFHSDSQNQPVAYIELTPDWPGTASHELMEMLADPSGNRMHPPALLPDGLDPGQVGLGAGGLVEYLVEVADPCEAASYQVGATKLSDFIDPDWYQSTLPAPGVCSHTGLLSRPREVADGGYVSFKRADDEWFQVFNQGGSLQVSSLGKFARGEGAWSLREWVDSKAREHRASQSTAATTDPL